MAALAGATLDLFQIAHPSFPRLVRSQYLPETTGHLVAGNAIIAWGAHGLSRLTGATGRQLIDNEPVLGAVVFGNMIAVLYRQRLVMRTADLATVVATYSVADATAIAATTRNLVVATAQGLLIYAQIARHTLSLAGISAVSGVRALTSSPAVLPRTAVAAGDECGSWSVIDLAYPSQARRVAQYRKRPWFGAGYLVNLLLVRINDEGSVAISSTGRSVQS